MPPLRAPMTARMGQIVRQRRWPLLFRIVMALLVGLALGVAIDVARNGGPRLWLARHGLPPPYLAAGRLVDIGPRSFYLDCRGSGSPTIVLEAGMGGGAGSWSPVLDDLAGVSRVCAYDRANLGSSDPRGTHTLADAARDLAALLEAAGERLPYLVVGHSLGAEYARTFATLYRDRVVGLVLLDPFAPDLQGRWIDPLLGALRPEYATHTDDLRALVSRVESLDWPTSEAGLRAGSVAGLPIEVLVARRYESRLDAGTNAAIAQAWRSAYESLSPGMVGYGFAEGSGHVIPVDRPDLVVEVVRGLVVRIRAGG